MQVIDENGNSIPKQSSKRVVAGILGILLGEFGIHKFILGYTKEGFLQIILSILTCGIGGLIGVIEGIIYLTKTDEEFVYIYQINKKSWF
jgi:TM2 domain-containing membrane protein YozV